MLFLSVFAYSAQKLAEQNGTPWVPLLESLNPHRGLPPELSPWRGLQTFCEIGQLPEKTLYFIGAGTLITKARSRAAGKFLESEADVWITVDDDVFGDQTVCRRLIDTARETRGVVSAPCSLRNGCSMNFALAPNTRPEGDRVRALRTGLGLVAMHREAIELMARSAHWIERSDCEAFRYPVLFREAIRQGKWIGEDYWFSDLAVAMGIPIHVLLDAPTDHAGHRAKVDRELAVYVDPGTALTMG